MLIIGIAGGTGSGKTTVVRKIVESLPEASVAVSKLSPSLSVEELIKGALKNMTLRF